MNPINDIVCNLLETPFSRWKDEDKRDVIIHGRPTTLLSISARKELKKSGKSYNLNCKSTWFTSYKWLCSSSIFEKLFCWPCLLFSNKHSVWNKDGFTDIVNITRALHKHGDSSEHLKSEIMLRNFEKHQNTIADALKENTRLCKIQFNENVRLNRLFLQTVIDAVLYLSKQELTFRGHDESSDSVNRGNLKELLELLISRSTLEIRNQYEKIKNVFTGDSKTIQNELMDCISDYLNKHVEKDIKEANFIAIEVDDTTDITQTSQCSLIIRFVNPEGSIVERFLGFHDVSINRTVETLHQMLDTTLEKFDYTNKLIGQCYDGASVMSEHLNGLQKKIKEKAPQAVFIHSLAHRLNLVLQQSLRKISQCRIFFASLSGISTFFHHSAKKSTILTSFSARRIPTITETRWSSNFKLLPAIVEDWDKLKEVFQFVVTSAESDNKSIQLAKGFLNDFNDFDFTFLALVFNEIFEATDKLYNDLEKKSLDINFCITQINETREILVKKRTDNFFELILGKANAITEVTISKRPYARLNQEIIRRKYRALFYELLDHVLMEMDVRFQDCEKLQFVCLADTTKFERYSSRFPIEAFENLETFYGKIFAKRERLKNELRLLYSDASYRNMSLQAFIRKLNENKDIFTEAYKLFCLILTLPSTSASMERSFSCLERIKTYSQNSISQERLSSLANISIQNELLLELTRTQPFYEDIIDKFTALKDRRIDLVYKN